MVFSRRKSVPFPATAVRPLAIIKRLWFIVFLLAAALAVVSPVQAGTIQPGLQARLLALPPEQEIAVIVTLTEQEDFRRFRDLGKEERRAKIGGALRARAETSQLPLREFFRKKKARDLISFWIFNGMAVTLRADQVGELADRPEVMSVRLDKILALPEPDLGLAAAPEWNLNAIRAPVLWSRGHTGSGVVVAGMDTGVDALHPDIGPRWRGGANSWYDPNGEHPTPSDLNGHGTRTMGIMVGGDAGGSAIGVAPGAQWIAVKVFNDAGKASESAIHLGFQWLLDPDGNPGTDDLPDVVNISWGLVDEVNVCDTLYQADIQALKAAEVAVVVAAGNSGSASATSLSPANYPESYSVGSVADTLLVAEDSSRGPSACDGSIFPDIAAPGVNVRTTDLTGGGTVPYSYAFVSGTSFAAPHVAGAMALLLSMAPQLSVAELEDLLRQTAVDLGDPGPDHAYGYGLLNVAAAYRRLSPFPWQLFVQPIAGQNMQE
ncbi:MAG: S8 family serine peptidase [Thermodesulfobacteriota bacterium]